MQGVDTVKYCMRRHCSSSTRQQHHEAAASPLSQRVSICAHNGDAYSRVQHLDAPVDKETGLLATKAKVREYSIRISLTGCEGMSEQRLYVLEAEAFSET